MASFHTGVCQQCRRDLEQVQDHDILRGVAKLSAANRMDPLMGFPDDVRLRRHIQHIFDNATMLEVMLVSLQHMQVDTCHFYRRRGGTPGLPLFRKNIISFPQELLDMKQLHHFLSHLSPNDVVNCRLARTGESIEREHRARLVSRTDDGWLADFGDAGELVEIHTSAITRRVQLPWKPSDLRNYLIIFRRRNADKDEYIEDLKVRRALIEELLQILTHLGPWRPDEPIGPMHQYYTGFELLQSEHISEFLPLDGVPEGLRFETVDEVDGDDKSINRVEFTDWLQEGKSDCPVAQALLVAWIRGLAKSDNECLGDLFDQLLDEQARAAAEEQVDSHDAPMQAVDTLKVRFLANFMRKANILTFALASDNESDIVAELVERILQELASVHAYLDCWRASGGFRDLFGSRDVAEALRENVADVVLPWPVNDRVPVAECDDGRVVKSFPVEFRWDRATCISHVYVLLSPPLITSNISFATLTDAF